LCFLSKSSSLPRNYFYHKSSQEALVKILEHLKNTKLEYEERIFALNAKLKAMKSVVKESDIRQAQMEDELDFRKSELEELKRQQLQKHRLERLDDWKALVQQLQADRRRLGEEVDHLQKEKQLLVMELKEHEQEKGKTSSSIFHDHLHCEMDGVRGSGGRHSEYEAKFSLPRDELAFEEVRFLQERVEVLENKNRRAHVEIKRLLEQVRRRDGLLQAWGRVAGSLGNYLRLFSGNGTTFRGINHPVIQV